MAKIVYPAAAKNVTEALEAIVAAANLPTEVDLATLPGYHLKEEVVETTNRLPMSGFWGILGYTQNQKTMYHVHTWTGVRGREESFRAKTPATIKVVETYYVEVRGKEVFVTSYDPYQRQMIGDLPEPAARIEDVCPRELMPAPCDQGSGAWDGQLVFLDELAEALAEGFEKIRNKATETAAK